MINYSLNTICSVADLETFFFWGGGVFERIEVYTLAKFHIIEAAILPLLHNFHPPRQKKIQLTSKKEKKELK